MLIRTHNGNTGRSVVLVPVSSDTRCVLTQRKAWFVQGGTPAMELIAGTNLSHPHVEMVMGAVKCTGRMVYYLVIATTNTRVKGISSILAALVARYLSKIEKNRVCIVNKYGHCESGFYMLVRSWTRYSTSPVDLFETVFE